jgi:hypothetical protein
MPWINPRPEVAIGDVSVGYDSQAGNTYGNAVVLAITAASEGK